jgi:hypothetical protein
MLAPLRRFAHRDAVRQLENVIAVASTSWLGEADAAGKPARKEPSWK